MIGYILILLIAVLIGLNADRINGSKENRKYYLILVFGSMLLFAVLRGYDVAIDYSNRVRQMNLLFEMNFSEVIQYTAQTQDGEYVYTLFIWLVSRLIKSPWLINSLMDAFVLSTFAWFFYRYSKDVTFSSLMFLAFAFTSSLNITRQYVAAACFLIALHFLIQKRAVRAVVPLLLAVMIHNSAWLLFAIYLLYAIGFRLTRKKLLILFGAFAVAFFAFDRIVELFIRLFPQYAYYTRSDWAVGDQSFSVLWLLIYSGLFICMFFALPHADQKEETEDADLTGLIMVCFMLYALISLLKSRLWFVARINTYFIFGYCMVISEILTRLRLEGNIKTMVTLALKLGVALWAVSMFLQNGHGILPYEFIWES